MESKEQSHDLNTPTDQQDVQSLLQELHNDRVALAQRVSAPSWLYPAIAAVTAIYVATPGIDNEGTRRSLVVTAIVATVLLVLGYQRVSGVKLAGIGLRGGLMFIGLLAVVLLLLSISFGLATLSPWWVALPSVASFGIVLAAGRWFDRLYREKISGQGN